MGSDGGLLYIRFGMTIKKVKVQNGWLGIEKKGINSTSINHAN